MFGIDNLCWISTNATLKASRLAEFLILQTGMTAFGKAFYRNDRDLVPNVCVESNCNSYFYHMFSATLQKWLILQF